MILITSAAYVGADLQAELGRIPPSYLPLANQALLQHQVESLRCHFPGEGIVLSLPESFVLNQRRQDEISELEVSLIVVPDDLPLRESVLYALAGASSLNGVTRILHGDTLIGDLPSDLDAIGIAHSKDDYRWEIETPDQSDDSIWCGYFAFSNTHLLLKKLVREESFVDSVRAYDREKTLERVLIKKWEDLGHLNTYFRARERRTTERSFNDIQVSEGVLTKSGFPREKILAEAEWFDKLPMELKPFTPSFYGDSSTEATAEYHLEFLHSMPLNELFIHAQSNTSKWDQIFDSYDEWFTKASAHKVLTDTQQLAIRHDLVVNKTWSRIKEYSENTGLNIDTTILYNGNSLPSVTNMISHLIDEVYHAEFVPGLMHGDLCFSNSMYDSRSSRLKFIDPRGKLFASSAASIGDLYYDVAKLSHSVLGMYDYIIAGSYNLSRSPEKGFRITFPVDEQLALVQERFLIRTFGSKLVVKDSMAQMVLLFFSMLPLHADRPDRQDAFLANAYRCYAQYFLEE